MHKKQIKELIKRLNNPLLIEADIIPWASPVPSFGNLDTAKIATIGLNPSDREFININGDEIKGSLRRFHTLHSLGINDWSEIKDSQIHLIYELCKNYFYGNPYSSWFKRLDYLIAGTSMSYYFPSGQACHLDIIPYATNAKWATLSKDSRAALLNLAGDTLGLLLKNSQIEIIVLNGQSVVDNLERVSRIKLEKKQMPSWALPRKDVNVQGYAYKGLINNIGGIELNRPLLALGYNHNVQSSYGVTSEVLRNIQNWISNNYKIYHETSRFSFRQ